MANDFGDVDYSQLNRVRQLIGDATQQHFSNQMANLDYENQLAQKRIEMEQEMAQNKIVQDYARGLQGRTITRQVPNYIMPTDQTGTPKPLTKQETIPLSPDEQNQMLTQATMRLLPYGQSGIARANVLRTMIKQPRQLTADEQAYSDLSSGDPQRKAWAHEFYQAKRPQFEIPPADQKIGQVTDGDGNVIATMRKRSGETYQINLGKQAPMSGTTLPKIDPNATGQPLLDQLDKIDPNLGKLIKGMADYSINPSTFPSRQFRGGVGLTSQQAVGLTKQYDPSYDETTFPAKRKYIMDFKGGALNRRRISLNQLLTHVDTLKKVSDDMDKYLTNDTWYGTKAYNTIGAWAQDQKGTPEVTAFNTAAERVADEAAAFYKGGNASATDIGQEKERVLNSIYNAPAQKGAFLNTTMQLLAGAVASLREGYTASMGKDPPRNDIVFPTARKALRNLQKKGVQFDMGEIDPEEGSSTQRGSQQGGTVSQQDQQAIEWAKQNPNDPRAKQILQANGVR